jgi:hypothetical protein
MVDATPTIQHVVSSTYGYIRMVNCYADTTKFSGSNIQYIDSDISSTKATVNHATYGNANLKTVLDTKASQASVDDVPTVAEFNARTRPTAEYSTLTADQILNAAIDDWANDNGTLGQRIVTTGQNTSTIQAAVTSASHGNSALKTLIDDVPTVAEMNARTLASASYSTLTAAQVNAEADQALVDAGYTAARAAKLDNLDMPVSDVEGGGGTIIPVNQIPVPLERTFILRSTPNGLRGEVPIVRSVGENQLFAVDFRHDLPANGRLVSLDEVTDISGSTGGIEISEDEEDQGVDPSQAKFKIELFEAGTYEIRVTASYDDSDGGGTSQGIVTLIVR